MQVCGVFLVLLSGVHTYMFWGLFCYPWLRRAFITAYYLSAAGCVAAGLRARTQVLPCFYVQVYRACTWFVMHGNSN